jgi:ribonuclease D
LRAGVPLPAEKVALLDLLRVLLKTCAARHKVAPRLIADGDDLERMAVEDAPDVPAMRGWRYDLFGVHAKELKDGKLALRVESGEVALLQLPGEGSRKARAAS